MYYNDFDFLSFFDDKFKNVRYADEEETSDGIGAVGIITHNQMIIKMNEPALDSNSNEVIAGVGHHYDEETKLLKELYPEFLEDDFDIMKSETHLKYDINKLNDIVNGKIKLRLLNNNIVGNLIAIELPLVGSISSNQIKALEKLSDMVEEACIKGQILVNFKTLINNDEIDEYNTIRNTIIPAIAELVDDTYEPLVQDKIIVDKKINIEKPHL